MSTATQTKTNSRSSDSLITPRSVRLLLALWFLGGQDVNQGEITKRIKLEKEKSEDCLKFFEQLEDKAIEITATVKGNREKVSINHKNRSKKVSITDEGIKLLGQGLQNSDLAIEGTIVGSWMAKALLKWIQQSDVSVNGATTNGKVAHSEITSQEEFKQIVLEVYDRLNRDYNLDNLVPIYRIRRAIGEKTSRAQFDEWLLEMQANDILQLLEGSVEDSAPDKIEDSITTKVSGLRCYAKRVDI